METEKEEKKREYEKRYREENRELLNQKKREKYAENKALINQKRKEKRENNWEKCREKEKAQYYLHRDKRLEEMTKFRETNTQYFIEYRQKNKDRISKRVKKWCEDNKDKRQFYWNKYRALKLSATPKWLTAEDWNDIGRFYKVAAYITKHTGIKHAVDHIIPLNSKYACGLHVPWNLQILTSMENSEKSNKILPEHCQIVINQ